MQFAAIIFLWFRMVKGIPVDTLFKGSLQRLTWKQIRSEVIKVNPHFAKIIDKLNPTDDLWFAKATYPYGCEVMQESVLTLPNAKGEIVPITDKTISPEIRNGIGYNLNSNPVSLVLKNSFEIYYPVENYTIPLSGLITPGTTFGAWRLLNPEHSEQPVFIWDMSAGVRSTFMLPRITETLKHKKIIRELGITADIPRHLMQHHGVFTQIANSGQIDCDPWAAEILYFSEAWFKHLDDREWSDFYQYFYHSGWAGTEYWRNQPMWNFIFSLVVKNYESKPNAHIMDTVKYIINMAVGAFPGLAPACDTISGPWDLIQRVYSEIYGLKNYPPVIIQSQTFNMRDMLSHPIYYSLQYPNATEFKPSSRVKISILTDLHEIMSLTQRYLQVLYDDIYNLSGTSLYDIPRALKFDYFHSASHLHRGMRETAEMAEDVNLRTTVDGTVHDAFPPTCLLGNGCIRVSHT